MAFPSLKQRSGNSFLCCTTLLLNWSSLPTWGAVCLSGSNQTAFERHIGTLPSTTATQALRVVPMVLCALWMV